MNHIIMGGLEKVLLQYLIGLIDLGNTVIVISKEKVVDNYFLSFFAEHNITIIDNIFPKKQPHFFIRKKFQRFLINYKLNKIFNSVDCIIDFANFSFSRHLEKTTKPKIGWCHGSILIFNLLAKIHNLNIYDKIICLTNSCKNDALEQHPELSGKIEQIYNPINLSDIKITKSHTRKRKYFIAVQRLDTDKDVKTIIDAFDIFYKTHKNYDLLIVGDGPLRHELQHYSTNKHIIFTGQVDKPYELIANAMALVLSSTTTIGEGLPNTLLEAHALGTLAISSDVPSGPREILLNGRAGILFKPGDAKDLASKLDKVATGEYDASKMIESATENLNRFDGGENLRQLLSFIKK